MFHIRFGLQNECSRERIVLGTNVPYTSFCTAYIIVTFRAMVRVRVRFRFG